MQVKKLYHVGGPQRSVSGGSNADVDYVRTTPMPQALGGLTVGYTPDGSLQELMDDMLYPYQPPAFTAFSFNTGNPLEIGEVITGNKVFSWSFANAGNVVSGSVAVRDHTGNMTIGGGLSGTSAALDMLGPIVKSVPGQTHTFRIQGISTNAQQIFRDFTVAWRNRIISATIAQSDLAALVAQTSLSLPLGYNLSVVGNALGSSRTQAAGTFNCTGGRHIVLFWDTSLGLGSFTSGGFGAPFTRYDVTLVNSFGVSRPYYMYVSVNAFSSAAVPILVS